jgi:glycosyltransferase involved in cell wall biosynthesis
VGYFDQNKNQSMLVRAVEIIAKECSIPFHVTFVGKDSGTLESVKSLAQDLNVLSYISFVDFQNDLDYYYQNANLLVLCSNQEGFPLVVLEAMRSCLPVVATQVGGTEEQVTDRKTGFLVPKGSHNILADRIRSLIESPSLAKQFGLSGYNQFSQKFTLDKMISNYESLFESTT